MRALLGKPGALQLRAWGAGDALLPATVREVAAAADPVTRTFLVKADIGATALRLGQTASVVITAPAQAGVIKLPLTAVYAIFLCIPDGPVRQNLHSFLETWRHVKPKTDGYALQKRGLPPGPRYRQVLFRLRQAWLDGEVKNESEEMELLDRLIKLE